MVTPDHLILVEDIYQPTRKDVPRSKLIKSTLSSEAVVTHTSDVTRLRLQFLLLILTYFYLKKNQNLIMLQCQGETYHVEKK